MSQRFAITTTIDAEDDKPDTTALRHAIANVILNHLYQHFHRDGEDLHGYEGPFVTTVHSDVTALEQFTVVGFWDEDGTRTVIAVLPGHNPALETQRMDGPEPFTAYLWEANADAALRKVQGTDNTTKF
jgi:hypothetical protein